MRPTNEELRKKWRELDRNYNTYHIRAIELANWAMDEVLKAENPTDSLWSCSTCEYEDMAEYEMPCPICCKNFTNKWAPKKPKWIPKRDEPMFILNDRVKLIGWLRSITDGVCHVTLPSGEGLYVSIDNCKPFDPSKIGMKWEEI